MLTDQVKDQVKEKARELQEILFGAGYRSNIHLQVADVDGRKQMDAEFDGGYWQSLTEVCEQLWSPSRSECSEYIDNAPPEAWDASNC